MTAREPHQGLKASSLIEPVSEPLPVRRKASALQNARLAVRLSPNALAQPWQTGFLVDEQDEPAPSDKSQKLRDYSAMPFCEEKSPAWMSWPRRTACSARVPLLTRVLVLLPPH